MRAIAVGSFLCTALAGSISLLAQDAERFSRTAPFIEKYCAECHDDVTRKAGLDLTRLAFEPENDGNFTTWVKVHDRAKVGEMPPKNKRRPDADDLEAFVKELASTLTSAERTVIEQTGRAVQRRINRYEYENVLRDLLDAPWIQIKDRL